MMRTIRCAQKCNIQSPTRMGSMQVNSTRADTLDALADHVISEEHATEEERPMRAERAVSASQVTVRNSIAGITGLIEDLVNILLTIGGHIGVKRDENGLQPML